MYEFLASYFQWIMLVGSIGGTCLLFRLGRNAEAFCWFVSCTAMALVGGTG